jgi:ubiquitin-protein ligase
MDSLKAGRLQDWGPGYIALSCHLRKDSLERVSILTILTIHIYLFQVGDDINDLEGSITGPPDTPYAGGKFW